MVNQNPLVHIGLAKTATTFLQLNVFPNLPSVHYLGKNQVSEDLRKAGAAIVRRTSLTWQIDQVAPVFQTELQTAAQAGKRPVFSEEDLSVFKFMDPETCARRLREVLGPYDVLLVVRDPVEWVQSHYHFRLSTFFPTTLWGINHWLRENFKVIGVGSDITEINFVGVAEVYAELCGRELSILPFELLKSDMASFARRLGAILGVEGNEVLDRIKGNASNPLPKYRITQAEAEFIKQARFILQRNYGQFWEAIGRYRTLDGVRPDPDAFAELETLVQAEEEDFELWRSPLQRMRRSLHGAFACSPNAHDEIAPEFDVRLRHIAHRQMVRLHDRFGVDLTKLGLRYPLGQ